MTELSSQGPLGKVLARYNERLQAGEPHFLSPEESRAELDETIANAQDFQKSLLAQFPSLKDKSEKLSP